MIQLALILAIMIVAIILADRQVWRADLTEDNRYTLSEVSRTIAEEIDDPITVTAYFSKDLPPNLELVREEFKSFLDEFRAYSGGNLEYEFINPNESDEMEGEAQQAGIQPLLINVRERDQMSQKRAYLGAVFSYEDKSEVLPVITPGASLEYDIALTVRKLTAENKLKIGLLQGHGEATRSEMVQAMDQLSQLYEVTTVTGIDTAGVPVDLEALMVVNPKQEFTTEELLAIDQYIMSGGKVLFSINRVEADLQRGFAHVQNTGIERLLGAYNVPINADLVRDLSSSSIQVQSRQGIFNVVNTIRYPYIPDVPNFGSHPISKGLESVMFEFVSSIDTTQADSAQNIHVLVSSSERAGTARGYFNINPMQQWSDEDFLESNIPLGAVIQGKFTSAFAEDDTLNVPLKTSTQTALVVIGDGDFVINGTGQQQRALPEDNVNLFVNAVDWLADDTGLIDLRTKGITNRPLDHIEDGTKAMLKYLNVLLPILLVIGYGVLRYQRRKAQRRRWAEYGV